MRPRLLALLAVSSAAVSPAAADAAVASLKPFASCSAFVTHARAAAVRHIYPTLDVLPFTGGGGGGRGGGPIGGGGSGEEVASSPVATEDEAVGPSGTGTNVQEAGVDEADLVKTNGRYVYTVVDDRLHVTDTAGDGVRHSATVRLPATNGELLLSGTQLLHLGTAFPAGVEVAMLSLLDISDPAQPRIVRSMSIDGGRVAARLTGSVARVVVRTSPAPLDHPQLPFEGSDPMDAAAQQQHARDTRRAFRRQIARSSARDFLPRRVMRNRRGRAIARSATAVPCNGVRRPAGPFAGLDTVTVLTIDLARGLTPVDSDAVLTNADVVYASPTALYLASVDYGLLERPSRRARTQVHKFALDGPVTTYRGSGDVPGYALNQFSLSERDGVLRIATTQMPLWFDLSGVRPSESFLTTLTETSTGHLAKLAQIDGLGRDERIYSVRFVGDQGYVVTFRETDPLYVVDLRDPRAPKVTGELKIRGYSAYLHPVGPGRLLGVGQDATEQGRRLGVQISLFDVSDPAAPRRLHQRTVGALSSSEAEYDHRAFLFWPATGLTMLPVVSYERGGFTGALGFRVSPGGIAELGRVDHGGESSPEDRYETTPLRSVVIGDQVVTVSRLGVRASRLDDLRDLGFAAF